MKTNNQPDVWVIWISNEEYSDVIGVKRNFDEALNAISDYVDVKNIKQPTRNAPVSVSVDGFSYFILLPLSFDSPLLWFDEEAYGIDRIES